MSTNKVNIHSLIKDERLRLGFSQAEMADRCEVSREMWGKYERGGSLPGAEVLAKFSEAGADINFIFTGSRVPLSTGESAASYNRGDVDILIDAFAHASDEGRDAMMAVARFLKSKQ